MDIDNKLKIKSYYNKSNEEIIINNSKLISKIINSEYSEYSLLEKLQKQHIKQLLELDDFTIDNEKTLISISEWKLYPLVRIDYDNDYMYLYKFSIVAIWNNGKYFITRLD